MKPAAVLHVRPCFPRRPRFYAGKGERGRRTSGCCCCEWYWPGW